MPVLGRAIGPRLPFLNADPYFADDIQGVIAKHGVACRMANKSEGRERDDFGDEENQRRLYKNQYPDHPYGFTVRCDLQFVDGKWRTFSPSGNRRTAKGTHLFVVQNAKLIVGKVRYLVDKGEQVGHIDLAEGGPIEFGGEIRFKSSRNGKGSLLYWNNRTGHYHDPCRPMDPKCVPTLPLSHYKPYLI